MLKRVYEYFFGEIPEGYDELKQTLKGTVTEGKIPKHRKELPDNWLFQISDNVRENLERESNADFDCWESVGKNIKNII